MNLYEYQLWQKTKAWLWILVPLLFVFLFIQPYVSLFLLFLIFGRFLYVKRIHSIFDKSDKVSAEAFDRKWDEFAEDMEKVLETARIEEISKINNAFPEARLDFIKEKNEYLVSYKNGTQHFKSFPEIQQWLEAMSK